MNIKVLTGYQGDCLYRELTLANLGEYCARWGHTFVSRFGDWMDERGEMEETARRFLERSGGRISEEEYAIRPEHATRKMTLTWAKHLLIREELGGCDWLLWLDADCKIMDMRVSLDSLIDSDHDLVLSGMFPECWAANTKAVMCKEAPEGHGVVSLGIMLMRNCTWTWDLLDAWWASRNKDWAREKPYECMYHGDNQWFSCHFMLKAPGRDRVKVVPKETMGWCHHKPDLQQFIIHLYGSIEVNRLAMLRDLERFVKR